MNQIVMQIKEYISDNPPNYEDKDPQSLMELFASYYMMCNPIENAVIREKFRSLEPIMKSLSRKKENKLFHVVSELCAEYETSAFQEGFRVGAQIIMELFE